MNSRQRVTETLNFQSPDRVPLDIGGTPVTGMHVSTVYQLRQAFGLDQTGEPVRVTNIYQMLGEVKPDLVEALGVDVIGLERRVNSFGILNQGWKEWKTFDGIPVLVPEGFNTQVEENGDLLIYPQGDQSVPPSGKMPAGGYYFDVINRQPPIDEKTLKVDDNLEEFQPVSDEDLAFYKTQVDMLYRQTDKAIVGNLGGTGFGDIAQVPASHLKFPKGIRDVEEWYLSIAARKEHIHAIFEGQCQIALKNLSRFHQAVGEKISIFFMSGTDFGGQNNLLFSPRMYRDLFYPYQKKLNDWVHENTTWKTFMHNDGAISKMIPEYIEAGFDILNPVQWTAANMDPDLLKQTYGDQITFWGAGVDTQKTLPFGSPDEVDYEVKKMISTLAPGGGFVFSSVHNIQAGVPVENLLAFFEAFKKYRKVIG